MVNILILLSVDLNGPKMGFNSIPLPPFINIDIINDLSYDNRLRPPRPHVTNTYIILLFKYTEFP